MSSERTLDWVDGWAHRLIRRAARRAPAALSERLEEEWLAGLAEHPRRLSRLRFAIGCCWATSVIARERNLAVLPAAGVAGGGAHFVSYARTGFPPAWRRGTALVLVACLHVAVFYAFALGLGSKISKVIQTKFETHVIDAPRPVDVPPPPPPALSRPRLDIPPRQDLPRIERETGDTIVGVVRESNPVDRLPASESPPPKPVQVNRVQGGPGAGFPSPDDYYPSLSIHMGEQGVATVKVCVDGKGRLTAEPAISESTGSARLDGGALSLAKAGSGHYRATTEDGRPVNSCYAFRIRFNLKN